MSPHLLSICFHFGSHFSMVMECFVLCVRKFNILKNVCYWSSLLTTPASLLPHSVIYTFLCFSLFFSFAHFLSALLWLYLCWPIWVTFLLILCALEIELPENEFIGKVECFQFWRKIHFRMKFNSSEEWKWILWVFFVEFETRALECGLTIFVSLAVEHEPNTFDSPLNLKRQNIISSNFDDSADQMERNRKHKSFRQLNQLFHQLKNPIIHINDEFMEGSHTTHHWQQ